MVNSSHEVLQRSDTEKLGGLMSSEVDNNELTAVGGVGISLFIIAVGIVYLFPSVFPEGTLYLFAGGLLFLVCIINGFKGIGFKFFDSLLATILTLIGVNKVFNLDIGILPAIILLFGVIGLLVSFGRFKK